MGVDVLDGADQRVAEDPCSVDDERVWLQLSGWWKLTVFVGEDDALVASKKLQWSTGGGVMVIVKVGGGCSSIDEVSS